MPLHPLAVASAFNLLCTGTVYIHDIDDPYSPPDTQQVTETYRIDLDEGRWCRDECASTISIAKVEPTVITLQDITIPTSHVQSYTITIYRETGLLFSKLVLRGVESRTIEQCEVRPFGGFPPRRF